MKNIIKDLLKSVVISIGMALVIFSLVCVVFDICNKGSFSLENYRLTKMVAASVIVGLGFGRAARFPLFMLASPVNPVGAGT